MNETLTEREELLTRAGWSRCEKPGANVFPTTFPDQSCWTLDDEARSAYRVFVVDCGYALEISHGSACAPSLLRFPCFSEEIDFRPAFARLCRFIEEGIFVFETESSS